MTKVHPLAFGGKLNGAADASISSRLRELRFLTPDDLNVGVNSGDDAVLALAQVCRVNAFFSFAWIRKSSPAGSLPIAKILW